MKYFDAHAHIQFDAYESDRDAVIARMQEAQVGGLIVGVDTASSRKAIELVQKIDTTRESGETDAAQFFAAVGLHPNDTDEAFDSAAFDEMARAPSVRAIGECGLDYYRPDEPEFAKKLQKEVFEQHIEIAVKYDKPLMIHARPSKGSQDAYHDAIDILTSKKREYGEKLRGDMHFFVGGVEEARKFIDLDFTLSYTAVLTFTSDYDDVVRFAPITHLLTETDSPYVAPAPNRGKRNEPTAVRDVVAAMARIRGEDEESVRTAIMANATRIFRFSL